jgi:hypothetical protein
MSDFLNIIDGVVTLDSEQNPETRLTEIEEFLDSSNVKSREPLSMSLDFFIKNELTKIDLSICDDIESARDYVFGEADFLELTLNELGIEISEHPHLRDWQNDFIYDYFSE